MGKTEKTPVKPVSSWKRARKKKGKKKGKSARKGRRVVYGTGVATALPTARCVREVVLYVT